MMDEKALEARRAYRRQWAKEHPDKVKAWQERYWAKKAAQAQAQTQNLTDKEGGGGTSNETGRDKKGVV